MTNQIHAVFRQAYNDFDVKPLRGELLRKFYVDSFAKDTAADIKTTLDISTANEKILVVGHRGCGKSTVLSKIAEELDDQYFVIMFSALDDLNMMDVQTLDLLLIMYMKITEIMDRRKIPDSLSKFEKFMGFAKNKVRVDDVSVGFFKALSFKLKVEHEFRDMVRIELRNRLDELQKKIAEACVDIQQKTKKEALIIIDDLDKLASDTARKIFIEDNPLITVPEARTVFTFPLESYYSKDFAKVNNAYDSVMIPVVNLHDAAQNYRPDVLDELKKLIWKRLDKQYITDSALKLLIDSSGGLLRDLVKFMQDACKKAILAQTEQITEEIAAQVVAELANQYRRWFDFPKYRQAAEQIAKTREKEAIAQDIFIEMLHHMFALEYRYQKKIWFNLHPCLAAAMSNEQ